MTDIVYALLVTLLQMLAAASVGGYFWGNEGALAAALGMTLVLLWRQNRLLVRVMHWAKHPETGSLPAAAGLWGEMLTALERHRRRHAELVVELETTADRFRRAAEALPEGVVILDSYRKIEWINVQAETCLGLSASRDLGSPINHLVREPEFLSYLGHGEGGHSLELRTQRNPGHILQLQLAPFSQGRMLLLVRDVTQLERLATMRRDFVANVSHELKTPLTVTLGFLETAQDALLDTPPEEIAHYLRTAEEQARRMQRLIDDLLTLSSLETDAPPPLEEIVVLPQLIAEVEAETLALSAERHRVEVLDAGMARLRGSSRELHSAFMNLASNAVRYTPPGGQIRLTWRDLADGSGEFCVSDSGIGIPAEHISRLTERFYRVDRGRSRDSGGTGLGLAIVKHVLERHGAGLRIESAPGQGSTFCAHFPASRLVR